jgi:anti-anti-sigma factor
MHTIETEKIGDVAVVTCTGRLVQSDAAFELRDQVTNQDDARAIVIDLSDVTALGGGGLGMLAFLRVWAHDHNIDFKLFDPSAAVRERLESAGVNVEPEIVGMNEMLSLLGWAGNAGLNAA